MPATGYLTAIREKIGHDVLLLPVVSVLVRDDAGRVLLRRHEGFSSWGAIGGGMDLDEAPADAAVRKARDAGITVDDVRLIGAYGGPGFRLTYPNGDQTANVGTLWEARLVGEPGELCEWFEPSQLAELDMPTLSRAVLASAGL